MKSRTEASLAREGQSAAGGPRGDSTEKDARYVSSLAETYLNELNHASRGAPMLTGFGRFKRFGYLLKQAAVRKAKELVQEHWDIAVFDAGFGTLKILVIYPGLYFAGLTWTIPIMEYAPLNTQLWTAGYLYFRKELLSKIGERRYGHSLKALDLLRDTSLGICPRDARNIHRIEHESVDGVVRIGRSRFTEWMRKLRRKPREPNVVLQSELRKMISDKEFRFRANGLRNNAYLYEEIAIRKLLETPEDRTELVRRMVSEPPLVSSQSRRLLEAIGETLVPSYARVIEQGNALTATLRKHLGNRFSATSLSLRWINWTYQRVTYRKLRELEDLHYRLLADVLEGTAIDESEYVDEIERKREEIETWVQRAKVSGDRAMAATSKGEAHQVIRIGIQEARSFGLKARLARTAFWLSPSARRAG